MRPLRDSSLAAHVQRTIARRAADPLKTPSRRSGRRIVGGASVSTGRGANRSSRTSERSRSLETDVGDTPSAIAIAPPTMVCDADSCAFKGKMPPSILALR